MATAERIPYWLGLCSGCGRDVYRDQEAVWYDGDWYCDLACLADALGAESGPADEIYENVAAR